MKKMTESQVHLLELIEGETGWGKNGATIEGLWADLSRLGFDLDEDEVREEVEDLVRRGLVSGWERAMMGPTTNTFMSYERTKKAVAR